MTETPKKISKKMKTQWVEQYTAGEPIKEIAEQDNVSEKTVLEGHRRTHTQRCPK